MKVWVEAVSLNADGEEQRRQILTIERRTLAALAGEFKPIVLVNPRGTSGSMRSARTRLNRSISFGKLPVVAA
jgi:hypothetical protein